MEGTLDRRSARLSRGTRGTDLGGLRATELGMASAPNAMRTREATRVSEAAESNRVPGKKTPPRASRPPPKWEARREARFSPVSFASHGPEPTDACLAPSPDGQGSTRSRRSRGRARSRKAPERERPSSVRRKASIENTVAALGSDGTRVLKFGTVSECRSRSDASPVATPAGAIKLASDTRGLARKNHSRLTRHLRRKRANTVRGPAKRFRPGRAGWSRPHAQASSGSHPEGCGLVDSGSPRAASVWLPIRWKGVRSWIRLSKPATTSRPWPRR